MVYQAKIHEVLHWLYCEYEVGPPPKDKLGRGNRLQWSYSVHLFFTGITSCKDCILRMDCVRRSYMKKSPWATQVDRPYLMETSLPYVMPFFYRTSYIRSSIFIQSCIVEREVYSNVIEHLDYLQGVSRSQNYWWHWRHLRGDGIRMWNSVSTIRSI